MVHRESCVGSGLPATKSPTGYKVMQSGDPVNRRFKHVCQRGHLRTIANNQPVTPYHVSRRRGNALVWKIDSTADRPAAAATVAQKLTLENYETPALL